MLCLRLAARRFASVCGSSLSVIGIAANNLGVNRRRWVTIIASRPKMNGKSRVNGSVCFIVARREVVAELARTAAAAAAYRFAALAERTLDLLARRSL
jgi:hypothetical protein